MADDTTKRGGPDRDRINPDEDYEVRFWAEKWGVSREQLKQAVQKAGPMAKDVARELGKIL
jgi:hypothetical protein